MRYVTIDMIRPHQTHFMIAHQCVACDNKEAGFPFLSYKCGHVYRIYTYALDDRRYKEAAVCIYHIKMIVQLTKCPCFTVVHGFQSMYEYYTLKWVESLVITSSRSQKCVCCYRQSHCCHNNSSWMDLCQIEVIVV